RPRPACSHPAHHIAGGYPQLARSFLDSDRSSHSQGSRIPTRQSLLRTKRRARNIHRSGAQWIEPTEKWRRVHRAPAVSASQGPRARDGAGTTASRSEAPQSNSVLPADRAYERWAEACVSPPWNRGSATEPNGNFVRKSAYTQLSFLCFGVGRTLG